LAKSFPRLISLWTSGFDFYPDENLAKLISSFVIHFNELVEVIINKGSRFRHHGNGDLEPLLIQQKYVEGLLTNSEKLRDSNQTSIVWTYFTEIRIWL
jgi:hypothetical protein